MSAFVALLGTVYKYGQSLFDGRDDGVRAKLRRIKSSSISLYHMVRTRGIVCLKQWITNKAGKYLLEIHSTHYCVHYPWGTTWYKIIVPRTFPKLMLIERVVDDNDTDVTVNVLCSAGPHYNFHHIPTTPKLLGFKHIDVKYIDDTTKRFGTNDIIVL